MNTDEDAKRSDSGPAWPWVVMALLFVVTAAPSGIARVFGFTEILNEFPFAFMIGFAVLFGTAWCISRRPFGRGMRMGFLIAGMALFVVNLGGCASIWNELAGIN